MKIKKFKNSLKIRKLKIGKLRLRTYISLGLIIVLLPIVIFSLFSASDSEAAWFDLSWGFRKRIPVTNSSGSNQTDFQVQITLDTAALVTDGKMQNDCDDLRITDINGNLLPQWVEPNTCNTTETLVWVKVPTVHTSGTDLYVYYGNPSAAAAASGTDNVFIRDMESAVAAWPMQETDVNTSYAEAKHPGVDEGRDIVINGGFDSDTNWTKSAAEVTISGGKLLFTDAPAGRYVEQTIPILPGKTYKITYTIETIDTGAISIQARLGTLVNGTQHGSAGTYTDTLTNTTATSLSIRVSGGAGDAQIDNVSIKQVDIASSADFDGSELLTDGDMEAADTSAWTPNHGTLSKQSSSPHSGSQLLRITTNGTGIAYAQQAILTVGKTYRAKGYARSDGNLSPRLWLAGAVNLWTGNTTTTWQAFDVTFIASSTSIQLGSSSAGTSGQYFEYDDVSVTEISPLSGSIPTAVSGNRPTVNTAAGGHLSKAYSFDGSNDYVNVYSSDLNSVFNPDEGTLVAWAKVSDAGVWSEDLTRRVVYLSADLNNRMTIQVDGAGSVDNRLLFYINFGGSVASVAKSDASSTDFMHLAITWNKNTNQMKAFYNGQQIGSTQTLSGTWVGNLVLSNNAIGASNTSGNEAWKGLINDVRLYDRALSADEIASLYSASTDIQAYYTDNYEGHELVRKYDAGVAVGTLAAEEVGPGPVAEWKFDEGQGQEAKDSSSNGNDGQLGSTSSTDANDPTWVPEDRCISGKCLEFDGSNDYVTVSNTLNDIQTVSFWVRPNTSSESIAKLTTNGEISIASGTVTLGTVFTNAAVYVNGLATYNIPNTNYWNHVVVTFDALSGDDINLGYDGSNYLQGFIDEVKIYPYARTEAQIKEDFNQGAAVLGLSDQGNLSDGLVGYWTMDETSGTTVADKSGNGNNGTLTNAQETGTSDASGNTTTTLVDTDGASLATTDDAYNGMILRFTAACGSITSGTERVISDYTGATKTFTVGTALAASPNSCAYEVRHQVGGKFGNGVEFDGENDYVQSSSFDLGSINAFSTSAWIKLDSSVPSNGAGVIYKRNAVFDLQIDTIGRVALWITNDNAWHRAALSSAKTDWDTWHHLVATYNGNKVEIYRDGELIAESQGVEVGNIPSSIDSLWIGRTSAAVQYTSGSLDETRIYNRALSPSEVKQLYEWAPGPVGYWDFEEGSGDTAFDRSGNGNNGSITGASYTQGKYGKALSFDGVDDFINMGDVSIDNFGTSQSMTVSTWVESTSNEFQTIVDNKSAGSNIAGFNLQLSSTSTGKPYFRIANGSEQAGTISTDVPAVNDGSWHYITGVYDRTGTSDNLIMYVDGNLYNSRSVTKGWDITSPYSLFIGAHDNDPGDTNFDGKLDDVKIYNYARSPEQIRQDMMGSGQSTAAGADPLPQPVAHWSFDEMQGQTANDKVGGNNGTLGADGNAGTDDPTWTSSGKVNGALSFDGGDFVNAGQPSALDFTPQTDSFAINFWANINNDATGYMAPVSKATEGASTRQYSILFDPDGLDVYLDIGGVQTKLDNILSKGAWHHYSLVVPASSTGAQFYVDGILQGTANIGTATNVVDIHIGHQSTTADRYFDGLIDEVKIYNSALSAEQVRQDMNASSTLSFGGVAGASEAADMADGEGNPPVAYWDFEEKSGGTAHDKSGNGNDGSVTGATWTSGCKYGACLSFDGSDDTVQLASSLNYTQGTVEAWIKPTLNNFRLAYHDRNTTFGNSTVETFNGNQWYHVAFSYDGNTYKYFVNGSQKTIQNKTDYAYNLTDASADVILSNVVSGSNTAAHQLFITDNALGDSASSSTTFFSAGNRTDIGSQQTGANKRYFSGLIDQVKIYDYARTPAQIAYDYNRGAPIAHWKFNECEGSTIHDSSGNGNHGTLTVTTDGGNSAGVGTCNTGSSAWGSGASGKYGSSLNFDGDGDYASIPSSIANSLTASGSYSISAWFKVDSSSGIKTILNFYNSSDSSRHGILLSSSNTLIAGYYKSSYSGTTTPGIQPDTWYHVVLVNNEGVTTSYLNSTPDTDGTPCCLGTDSRIGYSSTNGDYFPGQIDDVQIYNYALSASQVKKLYNQNSAIRFGP